MYQLNVFARQTLVGTAVSVSLSEKYDDGRTEGLATWSTLCADQFLDLAGNSLEEFLEQTFVAFVNTVSANAARL